MNGRVSIAAGLVLTCLRLASGVTIETVPVGYAGNAPDQAYIGSNRYGAVEYNFRISAYEVTNSQYAEFLNAKARSDPLQLYNEQMTSNPYGGIARNGSSGNYDYSVKPSMGDKPVNFVNWFSAIRFVNWLHNGQGPGDTETGAYTLLGGHFIPSNGNTVERNPDAIWFLPNENEWYKAAFYDPRNEAEGGPPGDDNYWLYPTLSDSAPTLATANAMGDISNPGANVANYDRGADWNGQDGNVTTVGSAGPQSASFFGTYDQAGNVSEWLETADSPFFRRTRQGSFGHSVTNVAASFHGFADSGFHHGAAVGFRVAMIPEPDAYILGLTGTLFSCLLFAVRRVMR